MDLAITVIYLILIKNIGFGFPFRCASLNFAVGFVAILRKNTPLPKISWLVKISGEM